MTEVALTEGSTPAWAKTGTEFLRDYAVLVLLIAIFIYLSIVSPFFLSFPNIVNILSQNVPLALIAAAGTFVIISGNFDLSTSSIFAVGSTTAAWVASHTGSTVLGLVCPVVIGLALGTLNGVVITRLRIHSFLATLATSLVYGAIAVLITGGSLITVNTAGFTVLGRNRVFGVFVAVYILVLVVAALWVTLSGTRFGRQVFAVGGNAEAAELSGISVTRARILVFAVSGLATGVAAVIGVSRIASGQPQAGSEYALQAIAAIILGGTSIYGGIGAVWRSVAGVYLIALIGNGFDLLNVNPQLKDLVTGVIILAAVALAAAGRGRSRS